MGKGSEKMTNGLGRKMALIIFAGGLLLANSVTARASTAFMLSEGEHQYSTGLTYATAKDVFDLNRNRIPKGCTSHDMFWHHSYTYGYSYDFNFFVNGAIAHQSCNPPAGQIKTINGVGDIQLGIRGRLDELRNGRTWELAVSVPTGYDNQKINRLGFGRVGFWGGVAWSTQNTGWEASMPSYYEFGTGIQFWFGSPATQSRSYLKWSWRVDEEGKNRVILGSNLWLSLRDGTATFPPAFAGFPRYANDYDALKLYAKYERRLSNQLSVSTSIGNIVWGRNVSASWIGDLALTYKWD